MGEKNPTSCGFLRFILKAHSAASCGFAALDASVSLTLAGERPFPPLNSQLGNLSKRVSIGRCKFLRMAGPRGQVEPVTVRNMYCVSHRSPLNKERASELVHIAQSRQRSSRTRVFAA